MTLTFFNIPVLRRREEVEGFHGISRGRGLSLGILVATTGLIVQSAAGHSPDFHVSILQIFSAQYLDPVWNVENLGFELNT